MASQNVNQNGASDAATLQARLAAAEAQNAALVAQLAAAPSTARGGFSIKSSLATGCVVITLDGRCVEAKYRPAMLALAQVMKAHADEVIEYCTVHTELPAGKAK